MASRILNIARNALRPSYLPVMVAKVAKRAEKDTATEARAWASARAVSISDWCQAADSELWHSVSASCDPLERDARKRLESLGLDLGGGGAYPLLAFIVRLARPAVVVETGVAAGWSSRAILEALAMNGGGRLYSSDFPYFRLPNPERYVGYIVPDELRDGWSLDLRGDRVALPNFVKQLTSIDLFHFDSDKSYSGRQFAMTTVSPYLGDNSIVIMDDIHDNVFFKDYVENRSAACTVFEFGGKYVGALGLPSLG